MWIASQDGLFCLFEHELQRVLVPKTEADYPAALAEGVGGKIWVAMNSGALACCDGNRTTIIEPSEPAMRCRFSAVLADADGTVWIGTLGAGLLCFRDSRFSSLGVRDGLPTENITQVLDDGAGCLWLGSPVGVICVRKHELEVWLRSPKEVFTGLHAYGRNDGLPTVGCAIASQPTAWHGSDGRLWFATSKGLAAVKPQDAESSRRPPLVVLEDLRVDGQPDQAATGWQNEVVAAPFFLASDRPIRLGPGRHHVEFRYTGLSFNDPERIRFQYMLEGLETAWIESTERTASYHDIPPGQYRFRVKARSSDGVGSESEAALSLVIPPHLWETRWFRLAALGVVLFSVAGLVFWWLQVRHTHELRALEHRHALERERARIAQDIHDDLGASLTRITMLSQSALNRREPAHPPTAELSRIYHTARSMTNAMDEIVWAINPSNDTLESLAAYFAEFVQEFLTPTGLKFNLDMPLALPPWTISSELRHNLFLAFKEALHNAVKHAGASEVVVSLQVRAAGFVIAVHDNGRGFDVAAAPGARLDPAGRGRGNGLANMRRRLEVMNGRCTIKSRIGSGTVVSLEVELRK